MRHILCSLFGLLPVSSYKTLTHTLIHYGLCRGPAFYQQWAILGLVSENITNNRMFRSIFWPHFILMSHLIRIADWSPSLPSSVLSFSQVFFVQLNFSSFFLPFFVSDFSSLIHMESACVCINLEQTGIYFGSTEQISAETFGVCAFVLCAFM